MERRHVAPRDGRHRRGAKHPRAGTERATDRAQSRRGHRRRFGDANLGRAVRIPLQLVPARPAPCGPHRLEARRRVRLVSVTAETVAHRSEARIFERFYRPTRAQRRRQGPGLSSALRHEAHGGRSVHTNACWCGTAVTIECLALQRRTRGVIGRAMKAHLRARRAMQGPKMRSGNDTDDLAPMTCRRR